MVNYYYILLLQEGTRTLNDISLSVLIDFINSAADQFSVKVFTNSAKKSDTGWKKAVP